MKDFDDSSMYSVDILSSESGSSIESASDQPN